MKRLEVIQRWKRVQRGTRRRRRWRKEKERKLQRGRNPRSEKKRPPLLFEVNTFIPFFDSRDSRTDFYTSSAENARQQARLVASQRFERIISGFTRAVHLGIFDIRQSSVLLKYWGLLGSTFDDFARLLMHDLRDEGNYGDGGEVVAAVIVESLRGVSLTRHSSSHGSS